MTTSELLLALDPWLHRRCQKLARQYATLEADEVYQRVVEEFLRSLERWLQQDPTTSVMAQARTLLTYCLKHVETDELRKLKREPPLGDDDDAIDRIAPPVQPVDDAAASEVLAQIRACTSPPCALCLLSLRLPDATERADAERAKAFKKGGANAVPRALDDAWAIFDEGRVRPALVADDIAWKDHVGIGWYTEGPPHALSSAERKTAADKVERYANRAAEDLRAALLGREST